MSLKLKHAAQAWVFAVVFFLQDYSTLLAPSGERRMISPTPLAPLVLAHLADILLVAVLFGGALALLRKSSSWRIVQWIVFVCAPLTLAIRLQPFMHVAHGQYMRWYLLPAAGICVYLLVKMSPQNAFRLKDAVSTLVAGFVVFAILITGELLRILPWHPGVQQFSQTATMPEDPTRPRLVWVILDELDYYQTFGHRDPSLQLPNFDKLREESVLYSDVSPLRIRTFEAVPSFLSGSVVTKVKYTQDNRLFVKTENLQKWHYFDPNDTVFGEAHRAGLRTAITGWTIPYCPTFAGIVEECYWTNQDASWDGARIAQQEGFLHDFWAPLRYVLVSAFYGRPVARLSYIETVAADHQKSLQDLTSHALESLRDSHADVIYLHLPVPHPPAGWDRKTQQFAIGGSYLDGLSHADNVLGQLLGVMETQPRWQHTTLIVQGDHGWRLWTGPIVGGTPEDNRLWDASPKNIHPLVLVHHPGQTAPETISTPLNLMVARDAVLSAIRQAKP